MTKTINKTEKKYLDIIASCKIEENEIIAMKSFMGKSKDNARAIFDALNEADKPLQLSTAQNKKGYDFLMSLRFTPTGKERVNNPFGYREQNILDNFSHFELNSFYNAGNAFVDFYMPLYECVSKDGGGFEYYYNGKINIVG